MSKVRTKPPEVRRNEILVAARKALKERGYHDVHLDDVSAAAGLSKGTLYLYFKDKESLFAAALEDVIDKLKERLETVPSKGVGTEVLTRMAAEMLDFVDEHQDFLIQFSREKPDLCGRRAGTLLQKRFQEHLGVIAKVISRCIADRTVRAHDPMRGSLMFITLVRMFMLQKVMGLAEGSLRPRAGEMMDLFLHGLGARPRDRHA